MIRWKDLEVDHDIISASFVAHGKGRFIALRGQHKCTVWDAARHRAVTALEAEQGAFLDCQGLIPDDFDWDDVDGEAAVPLFLLSVTQAGVFGCDVYVGDSCLRRIRHAIEAAFVDKDDKAQACFDSKLSFAHLDLQAGNIYVTKQQQTKKMLYRRSFLSLEEGQDGPLAALGVLPITEAHRHPKHLLFEDGGGCYLFLHRTLYRSLL
jgi:hypothetical protein